MATDVELTTEDGIGCLTLLRPATRNAMDAALMEAANAALDKLPDGIGALVLAGAGPTFCVGADIHLFRRAIAAGDVETRLPPILQAIHVFIQRLRALPVPTVAAVEGAAAGGGIGLACACDLRVVGASTVFVPAFSALGLSPDSGTSFHLTRALGGPAAIAAFLRNRRITSTELAACGLADEVAPDGDVRAAAQRLAKEVAGAAPAALLATRRLIDSAPGRTFDEQLAAEAGTIEELFTRADFAEGVAAFLERRSPKFTGA